VHLDGQADDAFGEDGSGFGGSGFHTEGLWALPG
jgi:hypothetical protein